MRRKNFHEQIELARDAPASRPATNLCGWPLAFFARGKLWGLEPREAVFFSLTRLKSSHGRRYAHPVALNMTACSKPSERFTSWSISNAFNLLLGFRAKKYHWNEYKESGPFLGEADLLVSKANLNFNQNSTSLKKYFIEQNWLGRKQCLIMFEGSSQARRWRLMTYHFLSVMFAL